jgi:prevent-host-death family protein
MTKPFSLKVSTSHARRHLAELVVRVQDPRAYVVLSKHGKPLAAIVSMTELKRIWADQDAEDKRRTPPPPLPPGFVQGPDGTPVTKRRAAEKVHAIQMTRKEERAMLAAGGLNSIDGGEIAGVGEDQRRWWERWFE